MGEQAATYDGAKIRMVPRLVMIAYYWTIMCAEEAWGDGEGRVVGHTAASKTAALLTLLDSELRGRAPRLAPVGAVVEEDGPLVRVHYGTHGTVDHRAFPDRGADGLIARQQEAFAARGEPVEWKVYGHDMPALPARLEAAGFTRGWQRVVLLTALDDVNAPGGLPRGQRLREVRRFHDLERVAAAVAGAGPQRRPFAELRADGRSVSWDCQVAVLEAHDRLLAAAWVERVSGTRFVAVGGMTAPRPEFANLWRSWAQGRNRWRSWPWEPVRDARYDARYLIAEADGAHRRALEAAGFQAVTTATSYHWRPPTPGARTRPVEYLVDDPEEAALWDRFRAEFRFRPSIKNFPGISEPPASVTWHLAALDGDHHGVATDRLEGRPASLARKGLSRR
jgi:hypothetical protein